MNKMSNQQRLMELIIGTILGLMIELTNLIKGNTAGIGVLVYLMTILVAISFDIKKILMEANKK